MIPLRKRDNSGFSMIQMSLLLAVAGIILAAVIPGGKTTDDAEKIAVTKQRMKAVENAMQSFMAANLRRPCPANLDTAVGNAAFGTEQRTVASNTVSCGSTWRLSSQDTDIYGNTFWVSAGAVPTKTLNLPDDYAFDGYGHRIIYMVDERAVAAGDINMTNSHQSCYDLQNNGLKGGVKIYSASTDAAASPPLVKEHVMWTLMSYGKDGNGSHSMQGSTARRNTASNDADTLMNAFYNSGSTGDQFQNALVAKEPSATFDDIVWYADATKNTCCQGPDCTLGFNASLSSAGATDVTAGVNVVTGDINGDGTQDLVIGNKKQDPQLVYVVLGSKTGWPVSQALNLNNITQGDGTYGVTIVNNNSASITDFGRTVAVGDVNNDGYDDIAISGSYTTIVFGKAVFGSNKIETSSLDGTNGLLVKSAYTSGTPGAITMGDINGDGYKDVMFAETTVANKIWVLYGRASASWASLGTGTPKIWDIAAITENDGFLITTATPLATPIAQQIFSLAAGNVNGDAYEDLLIGGQTASLSVGKAYIVFGRSTANWNADVSDTGPSTTNIETQVSGGVTKAVQFTGSGTSRLGTAVAVADMNNDGMKDLLIASRDNVYAYSGRSAGWVANTLSIASGVPACSSACAFIINTRTNGTATVTRPSWIASTVNVPDVISVADVNGDGKKDLLLGVMNSSTPAACSNGTATGSTYVLTQPTSGWTSTSQLFKTASGSCDNSEMNLAGFRIDGNTTSDYAYIPVVADLNKDGKTDIFIASTNANSGQGAVYALYGRRTVGWDSVMDLTGFTSAVAAPTLDLAGYSGTSGGALPTGSEGLEEEGGGKEVLGEEGGVEIGGGKR